MTMTTDLNQETAAAPSAHAASTHRKPQPISVPAILRVLLGTSKKISDIIFSPARLPQVGLAGKLVQVKVPSLVPLTCEDTQKIATQIIGTNSRARQTLETDGACDISYSVEGVSRFRVNIFKQRGSYVVVMRIIPPSIPTFEDLNLPPQLADVAELKNGIVLVTGPTGSGKSSTLAAIVGRINEEKPYHILTIEDPIEFLYPHKKSTIHQREIHSDTPSFALALRAALRQAPHVILLGEMRDRETTETALEAAETGHLILSTLPTVDASKTVERIAGIFPPDDQPVVRRRFSKAFRYIISQRLIEARDGKTVVPAFEILKSTLRTRECIQRGEGEGRSLLDAMRSGELDGMQHFDGEIERLVRLGRIPLETGLAYATNPGNLRLQLEGLAGEKPPATREKTSVS
jgi:twitching motility protein PilT